MPIARARYSARYVWVDALTNYISALGWGAEAGSGDALFQQFWPQAATGSGDGGGASQNDATPQVGQNYGR
jgi:methionyl-tRNA synthetase